MSQIDTKVRDLESLPSRGIQASRNHALGQELRTRISADDPERTTQLPRVWWIVELSIDLSQSAEVCETPQSPRRRRGRKRHRFAMLPSFADLRSSRQFGVDFLGHYREVKERVIAVHRRLQRRG